MGVKEVGSERQAFMKGELARRGERNAALITSSPAAVSGGSMDPGLRSAGMTAFKGLPRFLSRSSGPLRLASSTKLSILGISGSRSTGTPYSSKYSEHTGPTDA